MEGINMPNQNIFQQRIRPVLPRILQEERVFVYVPKASGTSAGIAYFPDEEFTVAPDGEVTLKWPMKMQIENNTVNDPLQTMARVKVNEDEFVHTDEQVVITHPTTGQRYTNTKAAIKLKRTAQDNFVKPGFMMVDQNDFETTEIDSGDTKDPGRYVKYTLKKNNPLEQPSLVKLNNQDFAYNGEATIRWPYAHDPATGTNRTNEYGLVKIRKNSEGYLKFEDGYLDLDYTKLKADTDVIPNYGGDFADKADYVTEDGFAVRDAQGHIKLKLTKDAIGLGNVENIAFDDYEYDDFGPNMKAHFEAEFNKKLDKTTWNNLFSDWNEPAGTTVEKVFTDLRAEDESIRDAMRTNRAFLGFFEDAEDLKNTYPAGEWTYGSAAYIRDTKSYWRVRPTNVNKVVEGRVPTKSDVPDDAIKSTSYRVGRRDTQEVYQWNGNAFVLTGERLIWVDAVVMNEEDIQPYIEGHASEHFFVGFRLGCRETGVVIVFNGSEWADGGSMYYEWADTYITTLAWNTFIETDPSTLKPDGVANVGTSGKWVSSDHVHPTDETRLAKSVFDATNITVNSQFTNNDENDFKVSFQNGGDKTVNIPFVRKAKGIHNWNGQVDFLDSEESEDYYWAGEESEFEAQQNNIKNKSMIFVNDGEDYIVQDLLQKQDLDEAGITINPGHTNERFVITSSLEAPELLNTPLTLKKTQAASGEDRWVIKSILPETVQDGRIVITKVIEGANPTYDIYQTTDNTQGTLLGLASNGTITETPEESYVRIANQLQNGRLVIATGNGRNVSTLNSINTVNGGIIVADGTGAIKSTSFTSAGKLLQTSGTNGEVLAAEIPVNTLVRSAANEFNERGIIVSTGEGQVERQSLGTVSEQLIVSDGMHGITTKTIANESVLYVNNRGKVAAFPTTANDAGKVLTVQSNGKFAVQNLPAIPTYLPVTSVGANMTTGTTLSFGQTSVFEEGVLYLW